MASASTACAFALLLSSVASVSRSAPAPCETLLHPLERLDPDFYRGPWALVARSVDDAAAMKALKLRDSITMYFSNSSGSSISYAQVNRFGAECWPLLYNVSVQGSAFSFDVGARFELTGAFVNTSCPDCAVMKWHVKSRKRVSSDLYLLSRRREVGPGEMEEFRRQVSCQGLPEPWLMDPGKELCPGPLQGGATETTAAEYAAAQTTAAERT